MKGARTVIAALLVCSLGLSVSAAWMGMEVRPEQASEEGFKVKTEYFGDQIQFRVTHLKKQITFPDGTKVQFHPTAELAISDVYSSIVSCQLQGHEKDGNVTFTFSIGKRSVTHARLHLTYDGSPFTLKNGTKGKIGTMHTFNLIDYVVAPLESQ